MAFPAGYQVKASLLRAYVKQVDALRILPEVLERVDPVTRAQIDVPPPMSSWMDGFAIEDIVNAVEAIRGMDAVRTMTKLGQMTGIEPILRPIITGMLRLFSSSPAVLYARFGQLTATSVRGIVFEWEAESERAGRMRIHFPTRTQLRRNVFVGFESGMSGVLDVSSSRGVVEPAVLSTDGSTGHIRVSW